MLAVRLPNIGILCAEYDEADDLYVLAGWRPVGARKGLDEAFLCACEYHADEFFSGAEDVPELNVPNRLLEDGIRRCLSVNPTFHETLRERLDVVQDEPDDAQLASRFLAQLGVKLEGGLWYRYT